MVSPGFTAGVTYFGFPESFGGAFWSGHRGALGPFVFSPRRHRVLVVGALCFLPLRTCDALKDGTDPG